MHVAKHAGGLYTHVYVYVCACVCMHVWRGIFMVCVCVSNSKLATRCTMNGVTSAALLHSLHCPHAHNGLWQSVLDSAIKLALLLLLPMGECWPTVHTYLWSFVFLTCMYIYTVAWVPGHTGIVRCLNIAGNKIYSGGSVHHWMLCVNMYPGKLSIDNNVCAPMLISHWMRWM